MNQHLSSQDIKQRFINKQAEGTQVMAGSLKIVKGLDVHGTGTFSRVESENINATNTISAKIFSGSGASLTNLPAGNLTGTINDARIAANVMRTNKAQTVTENLTIGNNATLYFAGGSAYWINKDGTARLNHATLAGDLNMEGSRNINFSAGGVGLPGTGGQKINFLDGRYTMGVNSNTLWYDAPNFHAFYLSKNQIVRFDDSGLLSHKDIRANGNISTSGNLDVSGSFDAGGANIFPDPYCMDGNSNLWSSGVFDSVQKPFDEAAGSMKLVASSDNHAVTYGKVFDISPGEDITISMYGMSTTTGTSGQLHIQFRSSSGVLSYKTHNFTYSTRWERISVTGTAPADATSFVFRYDNDGGVGKIVYTSMFQVERSKTLTSHKGFNGSGARDSAAFSSGGLTLSKSGAIFSGFNNQFIFKDHANGNVSLSAANGNLHLGYQNTGSVRLNADMVTTYGLKLADTNGVLYYKGENTDTRYLKLSDGGVVQGETSFQKGLKVNQGATINNGMTVYGESLIEDMRISSEANFPEEGSVSESTWSSYILTNTLGSRKLRLGVSNDSYTKAEIEINNMNRSDGSLHFKTSSESGAGTVERMVVHTNGNVGIHDSAPKHALSVGGNIHFNNGMLIASDLSSANIDHIWHNETDNAWNFVSDAAAKSAGNSVLRAGSMYLTEGDSYIAGRLGIGTASPKASLDVDGDFHASSANIRGSITTESGSFQINQPDTTGGWARGLELRTTDGATRLSGIGFYGSGKSVTTMYLGYGQSPWSGNSGVHITPNGNVGFGTSNPSSQIEVNNTSTSSNLIGQNAYGGIHLNQSTTNDSFTGITSSGASNGTQAGILFQGSGSYGTKIHFMTTHSHAAGMQQRMTLSSSGSLGIGTDSPTERLHVSGNIKANIVNGTIINASRSVVSVQGFESTAANYGLTMAGGGKIYQASSTDTWTRFSGDIYALTNIVRTDGSLQVGQSGEEFYAARGMFKVNGSTIFSDVSGRVAINDTSTTEHPLHVRSTTSYSGINLKTNSNSSTNGISFQNSGGAYTWHIARDGSGGNDPDLVFYGSAYNYSMSGLPERVRFTKEGKVGVGISNPSEMIHTSGNVQGTELIMGHPTSNTKRASWRYDNAHTFGGSSWAYIFRDDMNSKERIYIQQTASNQANISLNGNVSIGSTNTSPASPLYVDQGVADGHITINRVSSGAWTMGMPYGTFAISNAKNVNSDNAAFHITTRGDVGIGLKATNATSVVQSKLHVGGRSEADAGFKTGKYEIQHNTVEDSLDFLYVG